MNKQISIWRGNNTPPTSTHLWVKEDNSVNLYKGEGDFTDESNWESLKDILGEASSSENGLMSIEDKLKLELLKGIHLTRYVGPDIPSEVLDRYVLVDKNGNFLNDSGKPIDIYKDRTLESVTYEDGKLKFVYILADGNLSPAEIDMSNLVNQDQFDLGLQYTNGVAKIKLDSSTDPALSVSSTGLKLNDKPILLVDGVLMANDFTPDFANIANIKSVKWTFSGLNELKKANIKICITDNLQEPMFSYYKDSIEYRYIVENEGDQYSFIHNSDYKYKYSAFYCRQNKKLYKFADGIFKECKISDINFLQYPQGATYSDVIQSKLVDVLDLINNSKTYYIDDITATQSTSDKVTINFNRPNSSALNVKIKPATSTTAGVMTGLQVTALEELADKADMAVSFFDGFKASSNLTDIYASSTADKIYYDSARNKFWAEVVYKPYGGDYSVHNASKWTGYEEYIDKYNNPRQDKLYQYNNLLYYFNDYYEVEKVETINLPIYSIDSNNLQEDPYMSDLNVGDTIGEQGDERETYLAMIYSNGEWILVLADEDDDTIYYTSVWQDMEEFGIIASDESGEYCKPNPSYIYYDSSRNLKMTFKQKEYGLHTFFNKSTNEYLALMDANILIVDKIIAPNGFKFDGVNTITDTVVSSSSIDPSKLIYIGLYLTPRPSSRLYAYTKSNSGEICCCFLNSSILNKYYNVLPFKDVFGDNIALNLSKPLIVFNKEDGHFYYWTRVVSRIDKSEILSILTRLNSVEELTTNLKNQFTNTTASFETSINELNIARVVLFQGVTDTTIEEVNLNDEVDVYQEAAEEECHLYYHNGMKYFYAAISPEDTTIYTKFNSFAGNIVDKENDYGLGVGFSYPLDDNLYIDVSTGKTYKVEYQTYTAKNGQTEYGEIEGPVLVPILEDIPDFVPNQTVVNLLGGYHTSEIPINTDLREDIELGDDYQLAYCQATNTIGAVSYSASNSILPTPTVMYTNFKDRDKYAEIVYDDYLGPKHDITYIVGTSILEKDRGLYLPAPPAQMQVTIALLPPEEFVNKAGDTMTGQLNVPSLKLGTCTITCTSGILNFNFD